MADDSQDESSKTEEPTQRRLDEALKKGQVANSREVSNFLMLVSFGLVILWAIPSSMRKLGAGFTPYIESPHLIEVSKENATNILKDIVHDYAIVMIPIVLAAITAALLSGFAQHKIVFSAESIMPKLEKISPLKGLKRLFSLRSLTEFIKGLIKISLVAAVTYMVLWPVHDHLDFLISFDMNGIMSFIHTAALKIIIGVLSFMMVIAIVDFLYQRFEHIKNLRMSRHEIKEEMRQTEGDPQIKAKLKQIRLERVRRRMMAAVPKANVVITNPTHFSIALKYDQRTMGAPVVVAKGIDNIALKIREVAEANDVPLVENPPLARALYDAVDIDEEIPIEFYQAVAQVISYVYKLKNRKAA